MIRRYATPLAFKQALEQRIKSSSTTGADFARRRQLLVFDRFLARVVSVVGDAVTLKGGLVLEMRLARARTTKDVDLRMMGSADNVLERLQAAGRLDLGDYMFFEVQPDGPGSVIRQTAVFDPAGLLGLVYWYALYPIHRLVFDGMLRGIGRHVRLEG